MKSLYIIGNGFDIHHNMPTSYKAFYRWLHEKSYYRVFTLIERIYGGADATWWNDFENSLGEMEMYDYAQNQTRENYPNFSSDEFRDADWYDAEYSAENEFDEMLQAVKGSFSEWINSLPLADESKKVPIEKTDSYFITFNYTLTLEKLYRIPANQIWHIHGQVNGSDEYILGHGKNRNVLEKELLDQEPSPDPSSSSEEIESFYRDNSDFIFDRVKDTVVQKLASIQKPVQDIIARNAARFDALRDVEKIMIYGHSLCGIDMPYIERIINNLTNFDKVRWEFAYYSEQDKTRIVDFISKYAIQEGNVELKKWSELQNKGQLSLWYV